MGGTNREMELNILINTLKTQLDVLEAKIKQIQKPVPPKKFADFYGVLAGAGETSEEEIKSTEFKIKENLI